MKIEKLLNILWFNKELMRIPKIKIISELLFSNNNLQNINITF